MSTPSIQHGAKRVVVGAHYGLRDWLVQRVTAVVMALYTVVLLLRFVLPSYAVGSDGERMLDAQGQPMRLEGYDHWANVFAPQWMKLFTLVVIVAVAYHAWVGVRDILMDYIKPAGTRLVLHMLTIAWLVACMGWAIQVLWRL